MHRLILAAALSLSVALPAAADTHDSVDPGTVLATVNGQDITVGHLIALQARLPKEYQELEDGALYAGMLDQLIDQTVIAQSLSADPETDTDRIRLMLANERTALLANLALEQVATAPIEEDALKAAYDEAFAEVEPTPEFNASHILVETEEEAKAIIEALEGGADFAETAKEKSTGPSGPRGGELGWFGAGQMVPEFEAAVMSLEPGAVSAPVQTQFGWHVVKLNETREKGAPTLEEVRPQIEDQIRQKRVQEHLGGLREAADVVRPEVDLPASVIRRTDLLE